MDAEFQSFCFYFIARNHSVEQMLSRVAQGTKDQILCDRDFRTVLMAFIFPGCSV